GRTPCFPTRRTARGLRCRPGPGGGPGRRAPSGHNPARCAIGILDNFQFLHFHLAIGQRRPALVYPRLVALGLPELAVVEIRSPDADRAILARDDDHGVPARAIADHVPPLATQVLGQARPGGGIPVLREHRASLLDRTLPLLPNELLPVPLAQRQE